MGLGGKALEVSESAEEAYMGRLDRLAEGTVWLTGGCKSWYVDHRNGRLTTIWPEPAYTFRQVNSTFDAQAYLPSGEDYTDDRSLVTVP